MRELVIGEESESEEEMPPARVLGGGGGGGGLGDEAPELERQMGCMAGIFQIFDRRQRLLTARRRRPPPKMLPPGPGERRIFFFSAHFFLWHLLLFPFSVFTITSFTPFTHPRSCQLRLKHFYKLFLFSFPSLSWLLFLSITTTVFPPKKSVTFFSL